MIRAARRLLTKPLRMVLAVAGRVYVPGKELGDAMAIARQLADQQVACTLGYFHSWQESNRQMVDLTNAIVNAVANLEPKGYVSIKAPAFRYDSNVLAAIVTAAGARGVLAHFDSHEHATADATIACVQQAVSLGVPVGLSIPGRWQRSPDDADLGCRLGVRLRLVKGEWPDPSAPTMDMRSGFLDVVDCVAGRATEVAVATHDPWLANESIKRLHAAGTPCELELLNGLPKRALLTIARKHSIPVRIYIPFGVAWRPYAVSKAIERPRILWWIVRDSIVGLASRQQKSHR